LAQLEFLAGPGGLAAMSIALPDNLLLAQKVLRKSYSYDEACAVGHMR